MSKSFTTIDLFAGVGGIRLGFERAGFKTLFSNDAEPNCKLTFDANVKDAKLFVDKIENISSEVIPEADILLWWFPCQPFSIAGYRKGFSDAWRGDLFFEILRILRDKKPQAFLLENVKNLYSHDNGATYEFMKKELEKLGYHVTEKVMNTMEIANVPQNRERVYIVGFLDKKTFDKFSFPEKQKLTKKLSDIWEKAVDKRYYYSKSILIKKLEEAMTRTDTVYQWRRIYVRENKAWVCPTLTANMGTGGHNVPLIKDANGIRKLTPRECFRLQGFPDSFVLPPISDSKLYKQAGNSVSVGVIEKIAHNMYIALTA